MNPAKTRCNVTGERKAIGVESLERVGEPMAAQNPEEHLEKETAER